MSTRLLSLVLAAAFLAGFSGILTFDRGLMLGLLAAVLGVSALSANWDTVREVGRGRLIELAAWGFVALIPFVLIVLALGPWDLSNAPLDIDEARLTSTVRQFFLHGEVPHRTVEDYPGLHYWMLVGLYLLLYLGQLMTGAVSSFDQIAQSDLVFAGRALNAALYGAIAVITGMTVRATYGRLPGIATAIVIALSPVGVQIAGQNRNETTLLLCITIALAACTADLSGRGFGLVALGSVVAGIAAGVKYTGVFAIVPVIVAVLLNGHLRFRKLAVAAAGFALGALTTQPFVWLDFPNFVRQLGVEVRMTGAGHWSATENAPLFYTQALATSMGVPLLCFAAAGCALALATRRPSLAVLVAFIVPYQLFMTNQPAQFWRWVFPVVPAVTALAVAALAITFQEMTRRRADRRHWVLAGAAIVLAPTLWIGMSTASRYLAPTTYERLHRALDARVAEGDSVLLPAGWLRDWQAGGGYGVATTSRLGSELAAESVALSAFDWVVVPEPYAAALTERVDVVERITAGWGLSGSVGFDFFIARAPQPPPLARLLSLDLAGPRIAPLLGDGWGVSLPELGRLTAGSATVYLPARRSSPIVLELHLRHEPGVLRGPVRVWVDGRVVAPATIECVAVADPAWAGRAERCAIELPAVDSPRPMRVAIDLSPDEGVWLQRVIVRPRKEGQAAQRGGAGRPGDK